MGNAHRQSDQARREMELRLYQDGLCPRQVLRSSRCPSYLLCPLSLPHTPQRLPHRRQRHPQQARRHPKRVSFFTSILDLYSLQYRWWGPKVLVWLVLVAVSFAIPNPFFIFWGNYVSLIGATLFIILGLVLLVDFAHSWSETCLEHIDQNPDDRLWPLILVGSTAGLYLASIVLTVLLYVFFAGSGCTLNQFLISFNLALCVLITLICVHPAVQDANPRSGLAQASMVAAYCTYLITSAVGNHTDGQCNPLHRSPARNGTVIMGAIFTFLAIAYSTSRAATQSRALVGKKRAGGAITLPDTDDHVRGDSGVGLITTQPTRKDTPRYQALLSAVEAGAIPASALDEDDEDEDAGPAGDERDDERTGTRYNVSTRARPLTQQLTSGCSTRGSISSSSWGACTLACSSPTGTFPRPICLLLLTPSQERREHPATRQHRLSRPEPRYLHRPFRNSHVDAHRIQLGLHRALHLESCRSGLFA